MLEKYRPVLYGSAAVLLLGTAEAAHAERIDLFVFENEDNADVSGLDLWVDVTQIGSQAQFVFHNDSTIASSVTTIYFEQTSLTAGLGSAAIIDESGVSFSPGGTPNNPPGSLDNFGGDWGGALFRFGADNPRPQNGIRPGDSLTIAIDLDSVSFLDLLFGLQSGAWRIAQHVQALPDDASVWTTTVVPVPAAFWPAAMGLAGVAGLGYLRRRRAVRG